MGALARRAAQATELRRVRTILCEIPNVGPATATDLIRLGIRSVADLADENPRELYDRLTQLDGRPHDPCVLDVLTAAVAFARDGTVKPWWYYTKRRKAERDDPAQG